MSTEGIVVERPPEVVTPEKSAPPPEKKNAPKEKKPKTFKAPSHPPYFQMIKEALLALNEKSGSSPHAIAKHMEGNHKAVLPANFRKILNLQLKNSVAKGNLIKIKASYKLSELGKGMGKPYGAKKVKGITDAKTKSAKKSETPRKTAKKPRKSAAPKPKQPKSIKSPIKKSKKVAA